MRVNVRTSIVALAAVAAAMSVTPPMTAQQGDLDPGIARLVAAVSPERMGVILRRLESFETRSTLAKINVDICSNCHPFFTGKQKFVDTAGRVEKFSKKFGGTYSFQKTGVPAAAGAKK